MLQAGICIEIVFLGASLKSFPRKRYVACEQQVQADERRFETLAAREERAVVRHVAANACWRNKEPGDPLARDLPE
jgi:hypothetical protein